MSIFINPFPQYSGANGQPFDGGSFYFGEPNQDPVDNPKPPFSTKDLTAGTELGARQILDDKGAFQQTVYLSGTYSLALYDKKGDFVTEIDEWPVGEAVIPHDVVADMDADTELNVGDTVLCTRYLPQTNSGLLTFTIVPAGTAAADLGVIDDGRYIALTGSGHEARQEFTNGPPTSLQYGCACDAVIGDDLGTDDTVQLNRLIDNNQASFIVDAGSDGNNLFYRTTAPIIVDSDDTLRVVSSDGAKIGLNHAGDGVFVNGGSNGCFFGGKLGIYGKGTFKADTTGVSANPNSHGLHVKGDAVTISDEIQVVRVQGNGVFFDDGSGNSNRTFINLIKILGAGVHGAFFGNSVANNSNSWEYTIEAKGCRQSGVKYDNAYTGTAHFATLTTEDNAKDGTSSGILIDLLRNSYLKTYAEEPVGSDNIEIAAACSHLLIQDTRLSKITNGNPQTCHVFHGPVFFGTGGDETFYANTNLTEATNSGAKFGDHIFFGNGAKEIARDRVAGNGDRTWFAKDPDETHGTTRAQRSNSFDWRVSVDGLAAPTNKLKLNFTALEPAVDDDITFGSGSLRLAEIFAAIGTINTSDERKKTPIEEIAAALKLVGQDLKNAIGVYQILTSVTEKGPDGARIHVGIGAQTVRQIFEDHGLDAHRYGMFCYDEWDDKDEDVIDYKDPETGKYVSEGVAHKKQIEQRNDYEDGKRKKPPSKFIQRVTPVRTREAGDIYGIRHDQLMMLILASM